MNFDDWCKKFEEEGMHTITYIGYDNVENTSSSTIVLKVDNTGPQLNYVFSTIATTDGSNKPVYPKYVILFFTGKDDVVGLERIKYGFGDNATSIYSAPVQGFSTGSKSVKVEATDKLGNKTETTIEFEIKDM